MKIPSTLPITAEQSRAARFQLGLTQANVIEQSGLPGYKLKQFETGRFVPDMPFLEDLRRFYEGLGIELSDAAPKADEVAPRPKESTPGASMVRPVSRMCFYVSDEWDETELNRMLERMDQNDSRIADLLGAQVDRGFFGGIHEDTDAKQRELFGAMAENYLIFRRLQGRDIVTAPRSGPAVTHADLLAEFFAASPLAGQAADSTHQNDGQDANNQPGDDE